LKLRLVLAKLQLVKLDAFFWDAVQ